MVTTILNLREFYGSPRGQAVAGILRPVIAAQTATAATTVLVGYAPPQALTNTPQLVLMPAAQGGAHWPNDGSPNRAVLAEDSAWPLPDQSCDTVVIMHALEFCASPAAVLAEAWRVLKSQGRLVVVVPNRRGLWARAESTPFGHGQPFTALQLRATLRAAQFVPQHWRRTLFTPPFKSRTLLATAPLWEAVLARLLPSFGGALVMLASKQLYAPTGRASAPARLPLMPQAV